MNKDKKDGSIEELIRDATMSTPMSKSEMRDRLNKLIKQERERLKEELEISIKDGDLREGNMKNCIDSIFKN